MGQGEYLAGLGFLLATAGCAGWAGLVAARLALPAGRGSALAVARVLTVSAALIAVHLVPGALGLLTRGAVLVAAVALAAVAWRVRGASVAAEPAAEPRQDDRPARALAAVAAIAVGGTVLAALWRSGGETVVGLDATTFHLPQVGFWMQDESLWGLYHFVAQYSNGTYPMHGTVLQLAAVLPFRSTVLAGYVAVPFLAAAPLAVYALARELGASRPGAVLGAAAFCALPILGRVSIGNALTDAPITAFLGGAALFLARHHRTGARGDLVLGALGLGLGLGTKWSGLLFAVLLVAVWLGGRALARTPRRTLARETALVSGIAAVTGGFWLLRNLVRTGNPLFPVAIGPLEAPRDVVREQGGFTIAHYLGDPGVLAEYIGPAMLDAFAYAGFGLAIAAVVALVVAIRGSEGRAGAVAAAALLLLAGYLILPYGAFGPEGRPLLASASTRYALPALVPAAAAAAWLAGRRGAGRRVVQVLLVLLALEAVRRGYRDLTVAEVAGGIEVVLLVAAGWWWARRRGWRMSRRARVALAAVALLFAVDGADQARVRAVTEGYASMDPVFAAIEREVPPGSAVGLAGFETRPGVGPFLPAMGPRLENRVSLVGEVRDGYLYAVSDVADLQAALPRYDALLVGRGTGESAHERAARDAGWRVVASSGAFALLRPE